MFISGLIGLDGGAAARPTLNRLRDCGFAVPRRHVLNSLPFHIRMDLTELISGEAVESIGHRCDDSKAERLPANVVELCLRGVKRKRD